MSKEKYIKGNNIKKMFKTILHLVLLAFLYRNEATGTKVAKLSSTEQSNSMESTNPSTSPLFSRDSFVTPSTLSISKDDAPKPESSSLHQKLEFTFPTESRSNLINDEGTIPHILDILGSKDEDCRDSNDGCDVSICHSEMKQCMCDSLVVGKKCRKFSDRSVIALRVIALDAESTSTANGVSDDIFGIDGKYFTMKPQFNSYSHGKFDTAAFSGTTDAGINVTNGVIETNTETTIIGRSAGDVVDEVLSQAKKKIGNLEKQFDFVMLFLPPVTILVGESIWKTCPYLNFYLSVHNDK